MMKLWRHAAAFLLSLCAAATVAAAADTPPVPLTEEAFPDPAFLQWVEKKDSDGDGFLSQEELDAVTAMDLRKQGIEQLDGLEYFRNLESLNCSENDLTALVLEDFPALTSLTCNENASLETLDLSGVPALEHLYCFHSALTELDLQDVPALTYLAWGGSPLQELDLSNNPELQVLHVLGGDLADADLSHNPKLDMLLWNHTRIETLDLSNQTELTYLNCTDNQLTSLDLSANSKLETLYAGKNRLLAIRLPGDNLSFCDLTDQRPAPFDLPTGENGLSLNHLVPWARPDQISELTGGILLGDWIQLDSPNATLTYRYQDGSAVLDASVSVTGENGWKEPLSITDWTYGQSPSQPQAQAAFGSVSFSYGASADGPFTPDVPTQAGRWYVRADVEETPLYNGLQSTKAFHIDPAIPEYSAPQEKYATYGDYLASVQLESGFYWENGSLRVGDAGDQSHSAFFVPADTVDYLIVPHIPVQVHVSPYDGTLLPILEIQDRTEAENLVIRHGDWVLQEGKDYGTELTSDGKTSHLTITFQGNYTGTVVRSFQEETGGQEDGSHGGSSTSKTYAITAQASAGGTITPSGTVSVSRGANRAFSIQARPGYQLDQLLVDGNEVTPADTYVFKSVSSNHTISARFAPSALPEDPGQTGVSSLLNTTDHNAYLRGYSAERFGPENAMTRAQAAQLFYGLLKDREVPITVTFTDVPADAWYKNAVETLASLGIVSGVGDGRFIPDRPITRAEFLVIAMRFATPPDGEAKTFSDVHESDWFYEAVTDASRYGWVQGSADGSFGPYQLVTRAQATVIVNRMLGRSADRTFIDTHPDLQTFQDVPPTHWAYYDICEAVNGHDYEKNGQQERWTARF